MACPALQYFSTFSHKRHDFSEKNVVERKIFVLSFSTTFAWNMFRSKKKWARYDRKLLPYTLWSNTYIGLHVKYPLFLSEFNETLNFATEFRKNIQKLNFMKIRPVGTELFHADGQRDAAESRFSQFGELAQRTTQMVISIVSRSSCISTCQAVYRPINVPRPHKLRNCICSQPCGMSTFTQYSRFCFHMCQRKRGDYIIDFWTG